jgi:hypothetical protein
MNRCKKVKMGLAMTSSTP